MSFGEMYLDVDKHIKKAAALLEEDDEEFSS